MVRAFAVRIVLTGRAHNNNRSDVLTDKLDPITADWVHNELVPQVTKALMNRNE